ncbi:MAG: phage tail sheath C-terminal domain-containing protein [Bacteroidia bacterium]|nr:phage tail sheath C-terminal domain-containing protein [Bacteroidia bacterium]
MASTAQNPTVPGVYIQEISKFPPSVAAVSTAIPAFIGYTEKAQRIIAGDLILKPTRITSLLEYETHFGRAQKETGLAVTINQEGAADAVVATQFNVTKETISIAFEAGTASKHNLYYALQMYFANGGGPCYVVSVGLYKAVAGALVLTELQDGLATLESEDEPTLIVFPEGPNLPAAANLTTLQNAALAQCTKLQDRFVILDLHPEATDTTGTPIVNPTAQQVITTFRNLTGDLKYGAAYFPNLVSVLAYDYSEADTNLIHNQNGLVATLGNLTGQSLAAIQPTNGALHAKIKAAIAEFGVKLPPSSAVAGIYARVDANRGVWKAPANEGVAALKGGDAGLSVKVNDDLQDGMNVDPAAGKSINAIRYFTGKGTLVWGARTLAGNDNEWRYVSVRRFFNMVEESVKKASYQFVFEPNDANTWVKIQAMIENFLILQWRAGALAGEKPEHAFYVAVGLGKTMTPLDILEGRMNIEIGMAVVRPAEFIILRFSHKMQES